MVKPNNARKHQEQLTSIASTKKLSSSTLKKKLKLNEQLFKLHLKCADEWQSICPIVVQSIDYKLTKEMETH